MAVKQREEQEVKEVKITGIQLPAMELILFMVGVAFYVMPVNIIIILMLALIKNCIF